MESISRPYPSTLRRGTANAGHLRSANRSAVLDMIRLHGPISRSEIARHLKMSAPTLTRLVEELQEEDLVRSVGKNQGSAGRPSTVLAFNGDAYAVVGVDLGGTKMFGAVADLAGNLQHESYARHEDEPGDAVERLCSFIGRLLTAPHPPSQRIRGIGIGVPGVTRSEEGVVAFAPALDWHDLPLRRIISERFALPVFIENDVNLAALGEAGFGVAKGMRDIVCITMGTGVGAGIIIDGALYRGHNYGAGEIGYLVPGVDFLDSEHNGFGVFDDLASGRGIADRGRREWQRDGLGPLPPDLDGEFVFTAAGQGAPWAQRTVNDTINLLSLAIANIATLLNPEIVVLGGGVARSAGMLLDPIRERVAKTVLFPPQLAASTLGYRAGVMGGITLVLNGTTERVVLDRRL